MDKTAIVVLLSQQELVALRGLIDFAVKGGGMQVAQAACVLDGRLVEAMERHNQRQADAAEASASVEKAA